MGFPPLMNRIITLSLAVLFASLRLEAADLTGSYTWKPMKIGGGGYIVGMDLSSAEKGLMYCRTDVSGAYRWEPATSTWKQLVTATSMPKEYVGYGRYSGVDSIVTAPSEPNLVYMAFKNQVFRSTDCGENWTATTFANHKVKMDSNGEGRQEGERLGVDPANSKVVYFCPTSDFLWATDDGGDNWHKVEGLPAGVPPHGVNTIKFDQKSGTITAGGVVKTKVLYLTINREGIYKSSDAGATWTNLAASDGPGTTIEPRNAAIGPDQTYYVVLDNEKQAKGGCWKLSTQGKWTDITPPGDVAGVPDKEGGSQSYAGIAVDPFDARHLILIRNGGHCFVSTDQGVTWSGHRFHLESPTIKWLGQQENYWLSVGEIVFDPFERGKLWFAEGFGVWWATAFDQREITWHAASEGIEEACANEVIAPPGGKPLCAMWDVGVFSFSDGDTYTAKRAYPYFMAAWALDWCAADPKFIAAIFRNNLSFPPHVRESGYSTDGGATWQKFTAVVNKTLPADLEYGAIAVSANSPDHMVWAPAFGKMPCYTADRGATWQPVDLGGPVGTGIGPLYSGQKPICADRVLPDTFYLYRSQDGAVYRSTDGGAHFAKGGAVTPNRPNAMLKATPGRASDLWLSEGEPGHLQHSTDGGSTWKEIPGLSQCFNLGLGKAQQPDGYPTLYVDGIMDGVTGIYRSTDEGATWDQICGYPLGIFEWVDGMDGDKEVFGKIYLGFAQAGLVYGELRESAPAPRKP